MAFATTHSAGLWKTLRKEVNCAHGAEDNQAYGWWITFNFDLPKNIQDSSHTVVLLWCYKTFFFLQYRDNTTIAHDWLYFQEQWPCIRNLHQTCPIQYTITAKLIELTFLWKPIQSGKVSFSSVNVTETLETLWYFTLIQDSKYLLPWSNFILTLNW